MRKLFIGLVLIAVIAGSLFAFVACNENRIALAESEETAEPEEGKCWWADSTIYLGIVSGRLGMVSETEWQVNTTMGENEYADTSENENPMWCRGTYYFDGVPGESDLHITLMETWPGDDDYDPSNVRLTDNDFNAIDFGKELVISPDENGTYLIRVKMINPDYGGLGTFKFYLSPPSVMEGFMTPEDAAAPPPSGNDLAVVIGVGVAVVVVIIAAIVVTVVLVKKNKKKKAAAAAANDNGGDFSDGGFAA